MNELLPELLSPAGTPDASWAALAYGTDAVYAGLPRFSARAEADNFDADALGEMIGYAHHLNRRVYITFNTLVQQRELADALQALALIRDLNADGVIVQDLGVARLIRENFPQLRLHASTQLAVHNLAGAQQLASFGFRRVVLARELSVEAIAKIARCGGVETETFIHGALCYSYSGLCLFSSHLLGRSGNRGRCAYCCRQPFESGGEQSLPFSMKDFAAVEYLDRLVAAGVSSLKIEGRMKSPLYVAAVTDFYRRMLDGDRANWAERLADLQTIFGRPSTSLYLDDSAEHPVDSLNDGHRGAPIGRVDAVRNGWLYLKSNRALEKHDGLKVALSGSTSAYGFAAAQMRLASDSPRKNRFELPAQCSIAIKLPLDAPRLERGAMVYCSYSQAVRQRFSFSAPRPGQFRARHPVTVRVVQSPERVTISAASAQSRRELTLSGPFELARQPDRSAAALRRCFEKLGDTDWMLDQLELLGEAVFVPVSVLNDARRRLISELPPWVAPELPPLAPHAGFDFEKSSALSWSVRARRFYELEGIDEFVLEIDPARPQEIDAALSSMPGRVRLALPALIRDEEVASYRALIDRFPAVEMWEAGNVGALNLLCGKKHISADWSLYVLNDQAAAAWRAQGVGRWVLSPEDDFKNMEALIERLGSAAIVPVYQHTPLMISATRPAGGAEQLVDRSGRSFRVESSGREWVVFNEVAFSLVSQINRLIASGARRFRIDLSFGIDSAAAARECVRSILAGQAAPGHVANYERGLQ